MAYGVAGCRHETGRHAAALGDQPGLINRAALALVWCTVASSAVVLIEPAPVDLLMLLLAGLLPLVGLFRLNATLLAVIATWLVIAGAILGATLLATNWTRSVAHIAVTAYLYVGFVVMAGFVARAPPLHAPVLLSASVAAGLVAAVAGIVGYFDGVSSAHIFTLYGRASGTFKDPNVFAPFLILPSLYATHSAIVGKRTLAAAAAAGVMVLAVVLSFSRGAWMALSLAFAVYAYLTFVTAGSARIRLRIVAVTAAAVLVLAIALLLILQVEQFNRLLQERLSLEQSYDVGPEGRFGGQLKAIEIILEHPMGIGSLEFAPAVHHEEPHNVYITTLMYGGWLGGAAYILLSLATLLLGARHAFRRTATQPLFIVAYAALLSQIVEGVIIDSDHWRHYYFLMALVWGLMSSDRRTVGSHAVAGMRAALAGTLAAAASDNARKARPDRIVARMARRRRRRPKRAPRLVGRIPRDDRGAGPAAAMDAIAQVKCTGGAVMAATVSISKAAAPVASTVIHLPAPIARRPAEPANAAAVARELPDRSGTARPVWERPRPVGKLRPIRNLGEAIRRIAASGGREARAAKRPPSGKPRPA